jgi:hypothetical protein
LDLKTPKIKTCETCSSEYYSRYAITSEIPDSEYYFKACRKGDPKAKAVAVSDSPMAVLADASEITGLPRASFEIHEISKEEFEAFRSPS